MCLNRSGVRRMGTLAMKRIIFNPFVFLNTAMLITAVAVIPAKAGIQIRTGFRVKPGMPNRAELMSSCRNISGVGFCTVRPAYRTTFSMHRARCDPAIAPSHQVAACRPSAESLSRFISLPLPVERNPRHIRFPSVSERITCISASTMSEQCSSRKSETRHGIQRHSAH